MLRACMATQSGRYVVVRNGENGAREADYVGESPGYRLYKTSDGWIFLGVRSEDEWERLNRALGREAAAMENGASCRWCPIRDLIPNFRLRLIC